MNFDFPVMFRNEAELDRRCEAFASIVRQMHQFLPIRFRQCAPFSQRPYIKAYTRKALR